MSMPEMTDKLGLHSVEWTRTMNSLDRKWHIQGSSSWTGEGLNEGLDWMSKIHL